jgi:aminopeptidase N
MTYRISLIAISTAFILIACRSKKVQPSVTVVNTPAVKEDTIKAKEPVVRKIYQESNSRQNDIIHTKLEVNFDWKLCRMNGKATLQIKPYFYPVNMLYLNARGMDIKKLEVFEVATGTEGKKTGSKTAEEIKDSWRRVTTSTYTYENDSIKISLGRMFSASENYYVVIDYVAKPNELKTVGGSSAITEDKGLYFVNPNGENPFKIPQIWTQGETQASSVWFPTIDSPNERMTQEISMTVDNKYITLSNGTLISSLPQANGTRIDHWRLDQPHAPYLAMMAVGEFKKVVDTPWRDKEISYYVEKQYEEHAKAIFGDTREMIEFYSEKLGVPYAWPKYSQVVARDYVSGAMENTSATLHGDFVVYQTTRETIDGKKGNPVIAHELFHQWFGDLVTCESWSNLPLNESFATYGEYLWEEYKSGRDFADYRHWSSKQGYMHSNKEVDLIRFDYKDKEDMFDAFSYNKGGQVLHMLRKAVGDEAFFASLKNYLETNKFKSVEIHNLRLAFEETTGKDMSWFFNQWFLNKGRPNLKLSKKYRPETNTLELTVEQTQDFSNTPLYRLPLTVDIYIKGKAERKNIVIDEQKQTFTFTVSGSPQFVNFDGERQLLCNLDYVKTQEEYILQYELAPLFEDRIETLKELEDKISDPAVYNLFIHAAQKDKFYYIRNYAISKLDKAPVDKLQSIRATLISIYQNDSKTTVRAKALNALNKKFLNDQEIIEINNIALGEQSYAICGEALDGISKRDPKLAMEKAKLFENEMGKDILFPVATIYSNNGGDEQMTFFRNALNYVNGFELMTFCTHYSKAARRCVKPENVINAAKDLEAAGKGANKYIKFACVKGIKDIVESWENKERTAQTNLDIARKENKDIVGLEKELKTITETKEALQLIHNRIK